MSKSALCLCAVLVAIDVGAAPSTWVEVKSPHFSVITDAGEKAGRRTAWQFEQIRAALARLWPWAKVDAGRPFFVFAARDESSLQTLGPQYWEGKRFRPVSFGAAGRDKEFVALRTDVREPDRITANPYQSAYWSYASTVFTRSFPRRLPPWFGRGVAEVMSNTFVRGTELHVGRPLESNLERMNRTALIPLDEFLSADDRSHWLTQESDIALFDAQAWALVHYLMFGQQGAHGGRLNRYSQLLLTGVAPEAALKEAFGDMKPYFHGMQDHIRQRIFPYAKVPVSLDLQTEGFGARPLSAGEAAVLRAEILVAMRRPAEARAFAAEAAKADASLPGPWEIEGDLQDAEGAGEQAKAAFAKAAELGSRRARVYYRLAQLEWKPQADPARLEQVAATLRKARELEPDRADTLSFLADVVAALGQGDEALGLARRAVELEPNESYHRMSLAQVLWSAGRADEAIQAGQLALMSADDDSERRRAQEFLDFALRAPRPRPESPSSAAPTTPAVDVRDTMAPAAPPVGVLNFRVSSPITACFEGRDDRACRQVVPELEGACQSGQTVACRSLGSLYDGGWGVGMDKSRAATAYDRGCRGGDGASCARWAVLQARGEGVARDTAQALSTLQRLCAEKIDDACIGWALLLAAGSSKAEAVKARQLLQATCDRSNEEACRLLKSMPR